MLNIRLDVKLRCLQQFRVYINHSPGPFPFKCIRKGMEGEMQSILKVCLLTVVFCVIIFPSVLSFITINVSDKTVEAICQNTLNYDYCRSILDSDPRTGKAKLNEVAIMAVLAATSQARVNKYIVDDLQQRETDPTTKARLTDCLSDYTVTLGKLSMAYKLFDQKDYKGMERWANDAMKMTTKCEARFWKPPSQPSPIADYSHKMVWVNSIVLSVLSMLDHH